MLTLNQIHAQIVALANAHYQIAEVGMGTIAELQGKPDRSYPLLWLSNEGGSLDQNYKVDNIRLTMFGRVIAGEEGQDDDASEIEVLSDMQLILLDFLNYFHQQHGQDYVTDKSAQLEHFTERTNDRTAGYSCVLELKQFYDWNKCQIPQSGASIPPTIDGLTLYDFCDQSVIDRLTATQIACLQAEFGGSCDPVTVQVNTTTVATPASGDTYNVEVENSAGTTVGTSANPSVVADSRIGANGVYIIQTPAEVDATIDVHDTDGNDVGSDSGTTWEIADATVNVNGNLFDTVLAEGTINVPVEYENGTPVGTITGGVVEIPNPVTCASISVSVSDTTPDFGETITITATPTGISPTNYKFYYCTNDDLYEIADQAGNSYNWLVNQIGNISIVVIATDGSSSVTDMEDIVATTVFPLDLFSGATECNFLQLMTSSYTGALCTIRRSSDNALKDFYPEFVTLTLNSTDGSGTTLGDWIGANSGYIYRLYSQVGGQDILITTVNEQPRIVNAGVLEVDTNGLASAYFDGTNNVYTLNSLAGEARVDAYIVLNSSSNFIVPFGTGSTYSFVGQNGSPSTSLYSNAGTPLLYANNSLQSPTTRGDVWTASGGSQKIITHEALNTSTWANFRIINYVGAATQGKFAGIIAWTSDNSANRAAFTTALNAFLNSIY